MSIVFFRDEKRPVVCYSFYFTCEKCKLPTLVFQSYNVEAAFFTKNKMCVFNITWNRMSRPLVVV